MFEPFAPTIDAFAKRLARNYREVFGKGEPDHAPVLRATARLALERIAGTDALYHDALHTLFVADVGQAILRGRAMVEPVSRECWRFCQLSRQNAPAVLDDVVLPVGELNI